MLLSIICCYPRRTAAWRGPRWAGWSRRARPWCPPRDRNIREMGGAPRNPAPRDNFLVWSVKPSGCHCTDGHLTSRVFTEDRQIFRETRDACFRRTRAHTRAQHVAGRREASGAIGLQRRVLNNETPARTTEFEVKANSSNTQEMIAGVPPCKFQKASLNCEGQQKNQENNKTCV